MVGLYKVLEYQRLVVFSISGKFKAVRGPGLTFVNPFTERVWGPLLDLREVPISLGKESCLTRDNVPVEIEVIGVYKIADPARMVVTVTDVQKGLLNFTKSTLRSVVGDMELAAVVSQRERIAEQLRARIAPEVERWGVAILNVDISTLRPDDQVVTAMSKRKADIENAHAEAKSRVLRADAEREAATAEREAVLARAEAEKQAVILRAQGEKEAQLMRAEALAAYYAKLAALGPAAETILRFEANDALKQVAASGSAKVLLAPLEAFRQETWMHRTLRIAEEGTSQAQAREGVR